MWKRRSLEGDETVSEIAQKVIRIDRSAILTFHSISSPLQIKCYYFFVCFLYTLLPFRKIRAMLPGLGYNM